MLDFVVSGVPVCARVRARVPMVRAGTDAVTRRSRILLDRRGMVIAEAMVCRMKEEQ